MTDADLLAALRDCYDPLLRRNIVELNLVRSAKLTPDPHSPGANISGLPSRFLAQIELSAPTSDEFANSQLAAQIENRLLGLEPISRVKVTLLPPLFPIL
jgi:metal-sulfur cluster biosynthetic enzyme